MSNYFTDGSASPNPGPGGFAVIKNGAPYIIGGEPVNSEISRDSTTNIRMEGLALLTAFADIANRSDNDATVTTDSEFWINVLTKWAPVWASRNWVKKGGIKNLDIVQPLFEQWQTVEKMGVRLMWTRGHVGTELNELADRWANEARRRETVGTKLVDR